MLTQAIMTAFSLSTRLQLSEKPNLVALSIASQDLGREAFCPLPPRPTKIGRVR